SFEVLDVSDPTVTPTIVKTLHNPVPPFAGSLNHADSVFVSGNYAYVTASYSDCYTIIDISTPAASHIVGAITDSTNLNFPVDSVVRGGYAYVVDQTSPNGRLTVVDVSNPASPQVVSTLADPA